MPPKNSKNQNNRKNIKEEKSFEITTSKKNQSVSNSSKVSETKHRQFSFDSKWITKGSGDFKDWKIGRAHV